MYDVDPLLRLLEQQVMGDYQHQVLDGGRPDYGAVIWPAYGMPNADHTSGGLSLARMGLALLMEGSQLHNDDELLHRTLAAIDFVRCWQRPTGLIDLPTVDIDSPPDTAFLLQLLCPVLKLARQNADDVCGAARKLIPPLEALIHSAANGVVGRGFRTPNHRWVVCSALAMVMELFPKFAARDYLEQILAETIDINADGEYSERSTGIYSAVCNRACRIMADCLDRPDLLEPVRANLAFMANLINPDGTVETLISRRQDRSSHVVPHSLADSFIDLADRDGNTAWAGLARALIQHCLEHGPRACESSPFWMLLALRQRAERRPIKMTTTSPQRRGSRFFRASKLWRMNDGLTTATAAGGTHTPFSLRHGDIALQGLRVRGTYFHHASFQADEMEELPDGGVRLSHLGARRPAPGWDLPLGRPVQFENPHEGYYTLADEGTRQRWTLPLLDIHLNIHPVVGGIDLHVSTQGGYDRIPFIVEFAFATGGTLQTDDLVCDPHPGQNFLLRGKQAIYHTRQHAVAIGPGATGHTMSSLIASLDKSPVAFRLILTLLTPLDQILEIRCGAWSAATEQTVTGPNPFTGLRSDRPSHRECLLKPHFAAAGELRRGLL